MPNMSGLAKKIRQFSADKAENKKTKSSGKGYSRVPSRGTLSNSNTHTSLETEYDHQGEEHPEYPVKDYSKEEEEEEEEEAENFETTRLHFQQNKNTSISSANKYKMEMEIRSGKKDENLKSIVPFVKQISGDNVKAKDNYSINGDSPLYKSTTQPIKIWPQLFATIAVSLGSMVSGFTSGYSSPALPTMQHENSTISVSEKEGSWVGGLMPLAALAGGIIGGVMAVKFGRRNTLTLIAIPFIISWIVIGSAGNVSVVFIGRTLGGLCVGIGSLIFPIYMGEVLQPEVRGSLGMFPTAFGNIGILICYIAGKYLDWSGLAYFGATLPMIYLVLMFFIPETPRWYVAKGQNERAKSALKWLRGKETNVEIELNEIVRVHEESVNNSNSNFFDVFKRENISIVFILIGLMFFQQMSGINALMFYTVKIFKSSGSTIDESLSTIIVGIVNFVSTFFATLLIDRLGRKILLYISGSVMVLSLFTLGTFNYLMVQKYDVAAFGWVPLFSCVIYVLAFSFGFGPVPWLMMGEILPGRIKGAGASLVTSFNWLFTFIVTIAYSDIMNSIGLYGVAWLFGMFTIAGLVFTKFCVPETKGKSLEEIEQKLSGKV